MDNQSESLQFLLTFLGGRAMSIALAWGSLFFIFLYLSSLFTRPARLLSRCFCASFSRIAFESSNNGYISFYE
ncbi:hypothetical protein SCG7109_AD_00320 [Chlamydiales bacterium SCGC AG-110-M15]|nr:hypothetical protein SCG7109_AD_00320 [Chlamydiales bacterium SCGC AG-110-M15]